MTAGSRRNYRTTGAQFVAHFSTPATVDPRVDVSVLGCASTQFLRPPSADGVVPHSGGTPRHPLHSHDLGRANNEADRNR